MSKIQEQNEIEKLTALRDKFAGDAVNGMLAHSTRYRPKEEDQDWHMAIAKEAYDIADCMLMVRNINLKLTVCNAVENDNITGKTYEELYNELIGLSPESKLNWIATELSMMIHCMKDKRVGDMDVLDRLCACRNAVWDSERKPG